jgi:hypothetical protein
MWIIVLTTLLVAFISGVSIGAFIERGLWESALTRAHRLIDAHRRAADRRRRFRVIDGGAPDEPPEAVPPVAVARPAAFPRQAA